MNTRRRSDMESALDDKGTGRRAPNPDTQSALLAAIVDSSDDAIMGKSLDGTITSWNRGAEAIYGYKAEEIIGKRVSLLMQPDRADDTQGALKRIRNGERLAHSATARARQAG